MIQLNEDRNDEGQLTALRAAFTAIEPTPEVVATLDEHLPGWTDDQAVAYTIGNVIPVDLQWVKEDSEAEYLQHQWRTMLQQLAAGVIDKALAGAARPAEEEEEVTDAADQ